ncbi:MAG: pyridoxine 5'-phosphate synthase [Thermodesulfobacteriota bacterium]|jgi:pyridoxine 5-phosphate synthase|nr:MAG: pyridoxine 5'-phosphate synthase [Thermodesulfobacteriota bacterium]
MARLSVNIDHIATIREARKGNEPDPVAAAFLAELAGCDGIIVHLREDRRHIQERDVEILRKTIKTKLNMEMAATGEMVKIAGKINPDMCTLVPEKRQELTTEGGLDLLGNFAYLKATVSKLQKEKILVSLFIDPDPEQINAAKELKADFVEIHTGTYSNVKTKKEIERELKKIVESVTLASQLGLGINAGHGLNYRNIQPLLNLSEIDEFSIGHSIIARAVLVGFERAVKDMIDLVKTP